MIPHLLTTLFFIWTCITPSLSDLNVAKQLLPEESFSHIQLVKDEYDFIIVGSGPAGSAVANRLTEVPDWNVLLLEAGEEESATNLVPSLNVNFVLSNYSWGYKTEREDGLCLGLEDGVCLWPSGRGVGGGTTMNGMVYTRGHPADFDSWAKLGNPGWSYEEVLPYFLKSERMTIPRLKGSPYHSTKGLVNVEYPSPSRLVNYFIRGGNQLGYPTVDYNDPFTPVGISKSQVTMKNGKRFSAATAYLMPIKSRPNFYLAKNAFVSKILIDPVNKTAFGVIYTRNGVEKKVTARKEVILSAGAFNSAKLLMLSGIGHANHLHELNIPLLQNLPVGDHLQEHISTPVAIFLVNVSTGNSLVSSMLNLVPNIESFIKSGNGSLANNGLEAVAFIKTKLSNAIPDVELQFYPQTLASDDGILTRRAMGITDKSYYPWFDYIRYADGFSIYPTCLHPESLGKVRLRSTNPHDPPRIFPNFLSHSRDVKVLIEGLKQTISLEKTDAFRKIGAKLYKVPIPGCEGFAFGSDSYFECALRRITVQMHHQCCTCRMGPNSETSVVDSRLKVHGIKGLRIADTSVMPSITGSHTMAPAYMIGEKTADLVKQEWKT